MIWEYVILFAVLAWALFYLWRVMFKKKGCSCGDCPASRKSACSSQGIGGLRGCPEDEGEKKSGKVGK